MTTHALNSGAINTVPFPGAELGASIIELDGVVQVVLSIPSIKIRLECAATTSPKASGTVAVKEFLTDVAATAPSAVPLAIAPRVKTPNAGSAVAKAATAASFYLKSTTGATTTGFSTGVATSFQKAPKSATTPASATSSASSNKYAYNSALVEARAVPGTILERRKMPYSALASGVANSAVSIVFHTRTGGLIAPTAVTTAAALRYIRLSSLASPLATATVSTRARLTFIAATPAAAQAASGVKMLAKQSAATVSTVVGSVTTRIKVTVGAYTQAICIDYAAGSDFATKIPAPLERQIVVPPYDRTMKVV